MKWPPPEPTPSGAARTLIVANRQQMAGIFGAVGADLVMGRVAALAALPDAPGIVVNLDGDPTLTRAYADWQAHPADLERANRVTEGIRAQIWTQLEQHSLIDAIVLVGDDRVIPFRRVADVSGGSYRYHERDYFTVGASTVSHALQHDASLTDDFYAARQVRRIDGRPFYLPERALGRLVETPEEIAAVIDRFLGAGPEYTIDTGTALVVGGTNAQLTSATNLCHRLQAQSSVTPNCTLISTTWGRSLFQPLHLVNTPAFHFQMLHAGGTHWRVRMGNGEYYFGQDIANSGASFARSIVAATMSHGGLNVPDSEQYPLDLPQVYLRSADVFVGNTGWSLFTPKGADGLTGKLYNLFAAQLYELPRIAAPATVGAAWLRAKQLYWQEARNPDEADRKILHIATFYGLPMFRLAGSLADHNSFPSVQTGHYALGGSTESPTVTLQLTLSDTFGALVPQPVDGGQYYTLDGYANSSPGLPVQPHYFGEVGTLSGLGYKQAARGVLWTGGVYTDVAGYAPLVPGVVTEDETVAADVVAPQAAADLTAPSWSAIVPVQLDVNGQRISVEWGQYASANSVERIYRDLTFELTFSDMPDAVPPEVTEASAQATTLLPMVKLAAQDASGVQRVVVVFTDNRGVFQSMPLEYKPDMQKWAGRLPTLLPASWFAYAVDGAGNVTTVLRKGDFFVAGRGLVSPTVRWLYIPLAKR